MIDVEPTLTGMTATITLKVNCSILTNIMRNHCLGVHDECFEDGENCSQEPVLQTYNKFTMEQLNNLLKDLFDN